MRITVDTRPRQVFGGLINYVPPTDCTDRYTIQDCISCRLLSPEPPVVLIPYLGGRLAWRRGKYLMRLKVDLEPDNMLHAYVHALCSLSCLHACVIHVKAARQWARGPTQRSGVLLNTEAACLTPYCIEFFLLFFQTQSTTCPCVNPGI